MLFDERDTLGLRIIEPESNTKVSSLAHQVIAEQKRAANLAEEMRILYVAATRARERLILVGSMKNKQCRGLLCRGAGFEQKAISDWALRSCQSSMEWILYAFSNRRILHDAFGTGIEQNFIEDSLFSLSCYGRDELSRISENILRDKISKNKPISQTITSNKCDDKLLSEIITKLRWKYKFDEATKLQAKASVSDLTHRADEFVKIDLSGSLGRKPKVVLSQQSGLPVRIAGKDIGSAVHLLIARLDLSVAITKEMIVQTAGKLVSEGAISAAISERIDIDSIAGFFESEVGRVVVSPTSTVHREWPFTFALPAGREFQVVQGIIDMLVETDEGLTVIDFKTDHISQEQVYQRGAGYKEQLRLYGAAAEAILKKPIHGKWLYFLSPGCAFAVK